MQAQEEWVSREDQIWLGQTARQWMMNPARHYCDPGRPSVFDAQTLDLIPSIEGRRGDIDAKIEAAR
ncbi:MAG: hypothetical protein ABI959_08900 [Candidatus Dormiibacterota bacterium]